MLLFVTKNTFSQEVKLNGIVKDTLGVGLDMANVIAFNTTTKAMENYAITNPKGKYTLQLPAKFKYELKVSYIGFDTKTVVVDLTEAKGDVVKNIVLKAASDVLDEVELTYEMPITIKGDTIVYNSDSFRNGTEKKLGDVLKKLPGVEVNDDGEVEVEGKKITKVLVDGKEFFQGDSKIAVQNIPANALDKIEVLRNYSEVGQMKGVTNNEDNIAINIRLKKGKDKFWFGEITAGGGLDDRYLVHPKVFYYSPKTSINLLTDFNNVGQVPFTTRDYYRFTGGFRSLSSSEGTTLNVGENSIGLSNLQNNRANEISTQFGASNFNYKANAKLVLSGFGIFSKTITDMKQHTTKIYQDSGDIEDVDNATDQSTQLSLFKLGAEYKPDGNFQLNYNVFLKHSKQEELSDRESILNRVSNGSIFSNKNDEPYSISQNLNIYKTVNPKNIFAFETQQLYQKEQPFLNSISDVLNVANSFGTALNKTQAAFNLNQNKVTTTSKLDAKLNYYYVINAKSHLNITVGGIFSRQNFDSSIFQILDNASVNSFTDESFGNDVNFNFTDVFTGVHYKFIKGKFTIEPGVKAHYYQTNDVQLGTDNKNSFARLVPDFYASYQFKQTENIRFKYDVSNQFTDINNLSNGLLFNGYNSVYRGNRNLENALFSKYSLSYFNFVMYNYTNVNASINYTKKENAFKNRTQFTGIGQEVTSENSNLPDETFSANFRYGRSFRKIKINLKSNNDYSKFYNFRGTGLLESEVLSYSFGGDVGTNFNKAPNVGVGYLKTINDYGNRVFYTTVPSANFNALFLKHFTFIAEYNYYDYKDKAETVSNNYAFLNTDLIYQKKDSKWEYKLSATNLLNNNSINSDSFSEVSNTISTTNYFVQPRFVMFTLKYNL